MTPREVSLSTRLRRAGLANPGRAQQLLDELHALTGVTLDDPARALSYAADPDGALLQLLRLLEAARDAGMLDAVVALRDSRAGAALGVVLGGSVALGDYLIRHPHVIADFEVWQDQESLADLGARRVLLESVGADSRADVPVATVTGDDGVVALRIAYRRLLVRVAAYDLMCADPKSVFPEVAAALSDLAGAALDAGLALARAEHPDYEKTRLAIIGMGKCGARELNYVSDVDVIFVAEPAGDASERDSNRVATELAQAASRACDQAGAEPPLWVVDAALRPEGKDGALVRNVAAHRSYYERWADTWEFQALLKARPIAGDAQVGQAYLDAIGPMVWQAVEREGFVESAQAMRRRVEDHVPAAQAERQLKLGPGGLRDVEFTIQLLQLVHGRADETLRVRATLEALKALRAGGYVGRVQAAAMERGYRQLRVWEHRLQMHKMTRTHLMPNSDEGKTWLARASGFATATSMDEVWVDTRRDIRAMHLEMFYRPILPVVARLSTGDVALEDDAARERLAAVGYRDPEGALRHMRALTEGVSRRAAIQRQLLPAMIGWFARGADPDAGLLAFRRLSELLERSHWYLKLLRDSGSAAERLARILSTSGLVTNALLASAEDVTWLGSDQDVQPPPPARLRDEVQAIVGRADDPEAAITAIRGVRRREVARAAAGEVLDVITSVEASRAVSTAAEVAVSGALDIALAMVEAEHGEPLSLRFAIIGMGRFGGQEMGYLSDADVHFVYQGEGERAHNLAQRVATQVRQLLQAVGPQPPLEIDADLRPEGRNGPLARSLTSTAEYYARWSEPWEAQALVRARPIAGDAEVREEFVSIIDPVRYPSALSDDALTQMRRLKARMESERLPRGVDPRRHLKLGPGSLSDVEWTVQLVQMRHAHEVPELRTTGTLEALTAAHDADLIDGTDAEYLLAAWRLATSLRAAISLRGPNASPDVLPADLREVRVLAEIMNEPWTAAQILERYDRATRRARKVTERLFFGWDD